MLWSELNDDPMGIYTELEGGKDIPPILRYLIKQFII